MKKHDASPGIPFASLRWAVGGVLVLGVVSRLIGLGREVIVAGLFGTSTGLDAIFLGLAIPMSFCLGIGGGLSRAVVPVSASYSGARLGGLIVRLGGWVFVRAVAVAIVLGAAAPWWSRLMVPADSAISPHTVAIVATLASLSVIGSGLAGVAAGITNARARHLTAALTPIVYNVAIILSVVLLSRRLGVISIVVGVVAAEWFQILPLLPLLRSLTRKIELPGPEAAAALRALLPSAVFLAMTGSLMTAVDRLFAASLPEGSVSALAYSERLLLLPVMMIGMALQQPLFSRLSHFAANARRREFELTLEMGLRFLFLIGSLVAVLFVGFAEPLIALLLQRGAFTAEATLRTAAALRGYAAAIVFHSMVPLLMGAALASGKARHVSFLYLGAIGLNALLDFLLVRQFGLMGITLATSAISALVVTSMIVLVSPALLRRRGLWRTAAVGLLLAACGIILARLVTYFMPPRPADFLGNAAYLAGGAGAVAVGLALIFGCVFLGEYRRLKLLAGRAGRRLRTP